MIYGKLDTTSTYLPLLGNEVLDQAFDALSKLNDKSPIGITHLRDDLMYMNVHTYSTKPRNDCRFEGHRDMIDVQYMISGGELIEWVLKANLIEDGEFDEDRDFQYYHRPESPSPTQVRLAPGHFGIFFPEDGHCPKIADGTHDSVYKAVVKIHKSLLG